MSNNDKNEDNIETSEDNNDDVMYLICFNVNR